MQLAMKSKKHRAAVGSLAFLHVSGEPVLLQAFAARASAKPSGDVHLQLLDLCTNT